MPRNVALISAVALTVMMGGWLLSVAARNFSPTAQADPASPIILEVTATAEPAVAQAAVQSASPAVLIDTGQAPAAFESAAEKIATPTATTPAAQESDEGYVDDDAYESEHDDAYKAEEDDAYEHEAEHELEDAHHEAEHEEESD